MTQDKRSREPNGASTIYKGADGFWHGRVTIGVGDDGKPDRRHVMRKARAEAVKAVRELERQRDSGSVRSVGRVWTVGEWLTYWVEEIACPAVRENTLSAYRVAVNVHLIPGVGAHRLDRLGPEHLERLYVKMLRAGSSPATANQAHRTIRTALGEAERRGRITRNPAQLAKAPRPDEIEVEPYTLDEVRQLLNAAGERRSSARWALALALGLRQGEVLGLRWSDVDLDGGTLWVRRGRLRPRYAHGCGDTCGKSPGYCPSRWKRLLVDAGLRDGRLHDARHTAATVLLMRGPGRCGGAGGRPDLGRRGGPNETGIETRRQRRAHLVGGGPAFCLVRLAEDAGFEPARA